MKTIFPFVKPSESSYQSPGRWTEGRIPVRLGGGQVSQNAVQTTIHLRVRFKIGTLLPSVSEWSNIIHTFAGVSIIFEIRVIYKARFEGFEFFIVWPYAVFHKMQVVFYKSAHVMYL